MNRFLFLPTLLVLGAFIAALSLDTNTRHAIQDLSLIHISEPTRPY